MITRNASKATVLITKNAAGCRPAIARRSANPTSSKTCHACRNAQEIGWAEHWTCAGCGARHQRDDNAAINLARYEDTSLSGDSAVGPVGAADKRRADRKTEPRSAGGDEARKGTSRKAGKQPRDGVLVG
jgi:putative transposase